MPQIIQPTWRDLKDVISPTSRDVLVCTPYFTTEGINQLFDALPLARVGLDVVTRISPGDWSRGFSDPSALVLLLSLREDEGWPCSLVVHQRVHAKAYISDGSRGLVGSANLTEGGFFGNFELAVKCDATLASQTETMVRNESARSGRALSLAALTEWVRSNRETVLRHQSQQSPEAEDLADVQRSLDSLLGFGSPRGEGVSPQVEGVATAPVAVEARAARQQPTASDFLQWLHSNQQLPGAATLSDRAENRDANNLTGHFKQSYYSALDFLAAHPEHQPSLSNALNGLRPEQVPVISDDIRSDWIGFVDRNATVKDAFHDYAVLRGQQPPSWGGTLSGGGGGVSTLKRVLCLLSRFKERHGG